MVILLVTAGVAAGSLVVLPSAMKADVVDVDRLSSGADRTGLYFSSWSMVQKAVVTWAMGLALLLLAAFDFAPSGPNGTAQIWALKVTFAGLPTLCYAAAIMVIRRYPISEAHHRNVLRQLAARPN
jgi:Na+/melibiose symporter-like transporter